MKIGIQSNLWSSERHEDLDAVLAEISAAGYEGFEIGAHRVDLDNPAAMNVMLEQHDLQIAGVHTHGELHHPDAMQARLPEIGRAARFAAAVDAPYVLISGKSKRGKSEQELADQGQTLNRIGQICADAGVRLLYHNHFWEMEDDLREYRSIVATTDPGLLSLAMDVGWVKRAGHNPLEVIPEFKDRLAYFHLKDYRVQEYVTDEWTDLGEGYVGIPKIVELLKDYGEVWLTYERDGVLPNAGENAWLNREILRKLGV
jgi:inosose dehydratase